MKLIILWALCLVCFLRCSSSDSGGLALDSEITTHLSGIVSVSSNALYLSQNKNQVGASGVAGCSVSAYDFESGTFAGTATSDSSGKYIIKYGISSNTIYRIFADCGGLGKFAALARTSYSNPDLVLEEDLIQTTPRSSLIAAYVLRTILYSIESEGGSAISTSAKNAILTAFESILVSVTLAYDEARDQNLISDPNTFTASDISAGLVDVESSSDVDMILNAESIEAPAIIEQALDGGILTAEAYKDCDSSTAGNSLVICTRTIAKLLFNQFNFPILIKLNGVFGTVSCDEASLGEFFKNSEYSTLGVPSGYCRITSKTEAIDRNQGFNNFKNKNTNYLAETGNLDGVSGDEEGIISNIAYALYNNYEYDLGSLDKFVFHRENDAGLNARLLSISTSFSPGPYALTVRYLSEFGFWSNDHWINTCGSGASTCDIKTVEEGFYGSKWGDWSSATSQSILAETLSQGSNLGLGIFAKFFENTVPSYNQLKDQIFSEKAHGNVNISGDKEFYVLTESDYLQTESGINPCFDSNINTACISSDANPIYPLLVNLAFGSASTTGDFKKFSPIANIEKSPDGGFYLKPLFNKEEFSGVFALIRTSDGKILRDDFLRQRAVKIVLSIDECDSIGADIIPSGCSVGDLYNVVADWDSCSSECPKISLANDGVIVTTGFSLMVRSYNKTEYKIFCTSGDCNGYEVVVSGNIGEKLPFKFSATALSGDDSFTLLGSGIASAGEYYLVQFRSCSGILCSADGFIFISNDGVPYEDSDSTLGAISWGSYSNVGKYSQGYIESLASDWDFITLGTQSFTDLTRYNSVSMGPIINKNHVCSSEPYYIDTNGSGSIDCAANSYNIGGVTYSVNTASGGDISFSSFAEYEAWVNDQTISESTQMGRASLVLKTNQNIYTYSNPLKMQNIMTIAYNQIGDDKNLVTKKTKFDALKAFGFINYVLLKEGDLGFQIPNYSTSTNENFSIINLKGIGKTSGFNHYLGKSFKQFKTN